MLLNRDRTAEPSEDNVRNTLGTEGTPIIRNAAAISPMAKVPAIVARYTSSFESRSLVNQAKRKNAQTTAL